MKNMFALWTNDVEETSIWLNTLRDETGRTVLNEGMPILLDIYEKYGIKSTFYYTAYMARLYPDVVKLAVKYGHEIASHGKSHIKENGFDVMPFEKQKRHLSESKKLLEDLSGQEVISFRAPALRINKMTTRALIETGYKTDSSIASQRFDFFMSFGGMNKLKWLTAPRLPYKTNPENIFEKGKGPLVEVPLSALFFPYLGTTMRIFPNITKIQRLLSRIEGSVTGKPIVFDIHPNEFIDESSEPRVINRRVKNPVLFFIQDWLRSNLKTNNLGKPAIKLYEDQISYFKKLNFQSVTVKDYCRMKKLI